LFSIIIHSGSAYGGHYHTYIRDFDQIGKWEFPASKTLTDSSSDNKSNVTPLINNNKDICLVCHDGEDSSNQFSDNTNELVNLDFLKYETPLELLKAFIYNKHKYEEIKIETVCADLTKITGIIIFYIIIMIFNSSNILYLLKGQSWNKRYKSKYGSIEKFLRKNDENFELLNDNKYVKLKQQDRIHIIASSQYNGSELIKSCLNEVESPGNGESNQIEDQKEDEKEEEKIEMKEKYHWFDFDDSKITPIKSSQIKKQFEGKESAYMLFYRRKTNNNNNKKSVTKNKEKIPDWLIDEINDQNLKLNLKRTEYDQKVNSFQLDCFLDMDFYIDQSILNIHPQFENKEFKLEINKQKTCLNDLKEILINYCTDSQSNDKDKEYQSRKETCLNMLLDDENKYFWLLCNRTNSDGRYNYYIKALLTDPNENILQIITKNSSKTVKSCIVLSKHNDLWPIGDDYEPLRILVKFEKADINYTFTKCSLIKQVKEVLISDYSSNLIDNVNSSVLEVTFNLLKFKNGKNEDAILLTSNEYDHKSLSDLNVTSGDIIIVSELIQNSFKNESLIIKPPQQQQDLTTYEVNIINCLVKTEPANATYKLVVAGTDLINDLKIMSLSSFHLNEINSNECHLRYIDDDDDLNNFISMNGKLFEGRTLAHAYSGVCLHEDVTLSEILNLYMPNEIKKNPIEKQIIFLMCPGRSPKKSNNEITIKCVQESLASQHSLNENQYEIIINLNNCRVIDLTNQLVDKMSLLWIQNANETYYLKTMDCFGDAESVLNNIEALCSSIPLKHNDCVLITSGRLVPINHYKIKVWTNNFDFLSDNLEKCSIKEQDDEVVLNSFMDKKYQDFKLIEELIVKNEIKLEDLKLMIQNLLIGSNLTTVAIENLHIRMRVLKKIIPGEINEPLRFQMKKCLFEMHKTLKQLHLVQENDIYVQLLNEEDTSINQGIILIDCCRFYLKKKLCSKRSFKQILWNTNNGATYSSLRDSILKAYSDELEPSDLFKISLAKFLIGKYQWIILKDSNTTDTGSLNCNNNNNKKKKKKPNQQQQQQQQQTSKSNLKSGPFNLDDGDLIVFTLDRPDDNSELNPSHFMSEEDLAFNKKKNMTSAELSRLRKERKKESDPLGLGTGNGKSSYRRPEVGISIKIDDFNA